MHCVKCSGAVKLIEIYVHACMFEATHLLILQRIDFTQKI